MADEHLESVQELNESAAAYGLIDTIRPIRMAQIAPQLRSDGPSGDDLRPLGGI